MSRNEIFNELMDTLYESSRLTNSYESIPRNYGTEDKLFMVEVHTLEIIGKNKGITISEIANRTDRTLSAVSQVVNKLLAKGLVIRFRSAENHREFLLELTSNGEVIYDYHEKLDMIEYKKHLNNLSQFSEKDFETFIQVAKTINQRVKRVLEGKELLGE